MRPSAAAPVGRVLPENRGEPTYLFNDLAHFGRPVRLLPVLLLGHLALRDVGKDLLYLQDLGQVRLAMLSAMLCASRQEAPARSARRQLVWSV